MLKVTLLRGCFSRFSNYVNGTKSRKTSQFSFTFKQTNLKNHVNKVLRSWFCYREISVGGGINVLSFG